MRYAAYVLKWLGYIYLTLAVIVIAASYVVLAVNHGFGAVQEALSPHNFLNLFVTVATLAPGLGLLWLSQKLKNRWEDRLIRRLAALEDDDVAGAEAVLEDEGMIPPKKGTRK